MRFMRWLFLSLILFAILLGAGWTFLNARDAIKRASPDYARRSGNPIPVRTALVTQSSVDDIVGATALTEASQTATIRIGANRLSPSREFKATAVRINAVHVSEGAYVEEGDTLFELDDEFLQQVVKQREAEFTAATAELELVRQSTALNQKVRELELASAEANLAFRNESLTSRDNLLQSLLRLYEKTASTSLQVMEAKAALSQASFDLTEAKNRLQQAQDASKIGSMRDHSELEVATAKFAAARLTLEMTQKDLLACRVTSPAAGFILQVSVVPGEVIDTSVELTKVLRLDPIFVRVDFPQERIDDVAIGQSAEIVLDSFPKETFQGKVVRVSPQANTPLRVVPVVVQFDNSTNRIKAGISGFARVHVSKMPTVVVPASAVIQRGGRAMAFLVEDGRAKIREIRTGPVVDNGWVEVRGGLEPGNEIVIYDTEKLQDGDPVDADWRKWARRD